MVKTHSLDAPVYAGQNGFTPNPRLRPPVGQAYLVGAGPGHPDLITVRGLRLIQQADVLLYDRLIPPELLEEAPFAAEKIFVGKRPGHHPVPQEEINALLIRHVRLGKRVVRLKGGDPFVFGRGGEEALALAEAGLPFEIVPGITSAVAVPAFAGIPVTHREYAGAFTVITGHRAATNAHSPTDWKRLAHVHTLVILMGLRNFGAIAPKLIAAGRAPETPAAAISHGTTSRQRVIVATLDTLARRMAAERLPTPALIVVGEVAALSEKLAWFQPEGEWEGHWAHRFASRNPYG